MDKVVVGNLDMFKTMSITALLQKGINLDPNIISSYDILKLATVNGAKMLKLDDKIGTIKVGYKADLVILSLDKIYTNPVTDAISNIVYNCDASVVDTTIINGNILYLDKKLCIDIDENTVISKVNDISKRILQ
ncbi:MAG: amidohydrolase family protein [Clostridia bacterium]